jgi:hypothetical protein
MLVRSQCVVPSGAPVSRQGAASDVQSPICALPHALFETGQVDSWRPAEPTGATAE